MMNQIFELFSESFENYRAFLIHNLNHFSWANPIVWLFISTGCCFLLELYSKKIIKYNVIKRDGFWGDLIYIVVNDFVLPLILLYPLSMVAGFLFSSFTNLFGISIPLVTNWTKFSIVLAFILFFIIQDFLEYLAHYLLHRVPFFWAFHQIHHSPKQIGFASARRFHFGELLAFKPLLYIPFGILGMGTYSYFIIHGIINNFSSFFTHSNAKVKLGVFKYVLNNPGHHYWHHSYNVPSKIGVNFASILNVWDYLFGTVYLPKKKKRKLGLEYSDQIPKSILKQMIFPFIWLSDRGRFKH